MNNYANTARRDIMMKQKSLFRKDKMAILLRSTGKDLMIGAHCTMPAMKGMTILLPFCAFTALI